MTSRIISVVLCLIALFVLTGCNRTDYQKEISESLSYQRKSLVEARDACALVPEGKEGIMRQKSCADFYASAFRKFNSEAERYNIRRESRKRRDLPVIPPVLDSLPKAVKEILKGDEVLRIEHKLPLR